MLSYRRSRRPELLLGASPPATWAAMGVAGAAEAAVAGATEEIPAVVVIGAPVVCNKYIVQKLIRAF